MFPNGPNIPLQYMSLRNFWNGIKLTWRKLENIEFLTEFRRICSKVPLRHFTLDMMFQMAVALFCVNLRDVEATFQLKWHDLENTKIFRGTLSIVLKLILNCSNGINIRFYKLGDLGKCNLADMTQFGNNTWHWVC